jgi:hypothetical protein
MPPTTATLERRRTSLAEDLAGVVAEVETAMAAEDFNPEGSEYTALREERDTLTDQLGDVIATESARALAATRPAPTGDDGERISPMRQILREYDRGNSTRFDVEYQIQRAYSVLETGDPLFTPNPSRIDVPQLPVITPTLDSIRTVPTANTYDFVVPPPPVPAATVPEGGLKPGVQFKSVKVAGTLETDAHILDVTRQTLEDDAAAERTLRSWLAEGVRLKQDAKAAAAIAAAVGTGSATGPNLLQAVRFGKSELAMLGIRATTVYVNPEDAAQIDIDAMLNGHTGPDTTGSLWRMTVVEHPGLTAGTAIVGAMPQAVYMLYRTAIATYITDSGNTVEDTPRDRFSHNILGILGEGRSTVHIVQPALLVKCTATP